MNIAILGFAREGQAAYEYWNHDGNQLTICDRNQAISLPDDVEPQLGEEYLGNLDRFDLIVRTAGLHPNLIQEANPSVSDILSKVTSSVDTFIRACPTTNIIGVTGTKGKGTTSVLITKMLESAGYTVHLGGNIGIAPLKLLQNRIAPDDWVVLELSSFQLIDLKASPHIAVCVMVTEEHLNWHADYLEYITAKQQLFRWQTENDIAIYFGLNEESKSIASVSAGRLIPYMQAPGAEVIDDQEISINGRTLCATSEIKLLGKHNWQNICGAATAVWQVTHDTAAIHEAIISLEALPHRLEPVRNVNGIRYYNDSFASAPGSTVAALDAVTGIKVLVTGGLDKGLDLTELVTAISSHKESLRKVFIIGNIGPRIAKTLQKHGFSNYEILAGVTMADIVSHASRAAQVGDSVLFSPGSSSFDMFKDFEDRGNQFKEAVSRL